MQPKLFLEKFSIKMTIKSFFQVKGGRTLYLPQVISSFLQTGENFTVKKSQYLGLHRGHLIFTLKHPQIPSLFTMPKYISSIVWIKNVATYREKTGSGYRIYLPKPVIPFTSPPLLRRDQDIQKHSILFFGSNISLNSPPKPCEISEANFIAGYFL